MTDAFIQSALQLRPATTEQLWVNGKTQKWHLGSVGIARIFMSPLLQNTDGFAGLPSIDRHTNEKSYPSASLSNPMGILDDGLAHFVVWT